MTIHPKNLCPARLSTNTLISLSISIWLKTVFMEEIVGRQNTTQENRTKITQQKAIQDQTNTREDEHKCNRYLT